VILYVWEHSNGVFTKTKVIDFATSIIWVKRFQKAGNFELYVRATTELLELFTRDELLVTTDGDDGAMCVDKVELKTDAVNGDYLTITGKSAENIIARRIIRKQTNLTGTAENALRYLIEKNITNPSNAWRKIPSFALGTSHSWTDTIEQQITGKNLIDVVSDICVAYGYGFKVTFDGSTFTFELYKGVDRSFDQSTNTFIIFSPEFENIGNTDYIRDKATYYNSVYVAGQGEGSNRVIVNTRTDGKSGLSLREKWVDSRNTSSTTEGGTLTPEQYNAVLTQQGSEELENARETTTFNGELLNVNGYIYGVDYDLGDKVSVKNEYGITGTAVISEITRVEDANGYRVYPTLSEWSV
jgi:hypothetical protein